MSELGGCAMTPKNEKLIMKGIVFLLRGEKSTVSPAWSVFLTKLINDLDEAIAENGDLPQQGEE
jgi:hypothetical protein